MKILFLHFPKHEVKTGDYCSEIEGVGLPLFFSQKGHSVYTATHKRSNNQTYKIIDQNFKPISQQDIFNIDFDICITRGASALTYDQRYVSRSNFIVNVLPLGLKSNQKRCNFSFKDNELLKPPSKELIDYSESNFSADKKQNVIIYPASIFELKNQMELANLIDPDLVSDFNIKFIGPIYSQPYKNKLATILSGKNIKFSITGLLSKKDLAKEYINAKHSILCSSPPAQPYDPSPRVIPESIYAGNSFLIREDTVLIHKDHYQFGYIYKKNCKDSFNKNLSDMINNFSENNSQKIHNFCKLNLNMEFACGKAYDTIMKKYKNTYK